MTIYHKHHIVPKHAGGTDDLSNIIELTIEEHAEAHRILYEKYGRWQDCVAWKSLSKQISCAEATKLAQSLSNRGANNFFHHTRGNINPMYGKKGELSPHYGKKHSKETCKKKRDALIGRTFEDIYGKEKAEQLKNNLRKPKTEEQKEKLRKPKPKVVCRLEDKKEMSLSNFMNWNKKYKNDK
jgi:hypothetical protein